MLAGTAIHLASTQSNMEINYMLQTMSEPLALALRYARVKAAVRVKASEASEALSVAVKAARAEAFAQGHAQGQMEAAAEPPSWHRPSTTAAQLAWPRRRFEEPADGGRRGQ